MKELEEILKKQGGKCFDEDGYCLIHQNKLLTLLKEAYNIAIDKAAENVKFNSKYDQDPAIKDMLIDKESILKLKLLV